MENVFRIAVVMMVCCGILGCGYTPTSSEKEAEVVDQQLSQYSKGQPIPAFDWSLKRDLIIKLYKLRNQKVATYTVWRSDYGMIEGDTPSIGYGIPYDVSLTNPQQISNKSFWFRGVRELLSGVVEQQEPNGIFASRNTSATWIMSVDEETHQLMPIYVEGKVTVYPYRVRVDYKNNRVYRDSKPSAVTGLN